MAPPEPPQDAFRTSDARSAASAVLMLVDDDQLSVDMLQVHLQEAGYRHFVATSDARSALDLIRVHRPDVVLLGLRMPEVSGLDILGEMRKDPVLSATAVLVITASTDHRERLLALGLGATDFLHKPIDPAELVLRLRNTLEAKAWRERMARTDLLTGLPNLVAATERLEWSVAQAQRSAGRVAVLQLAVDRFEDVQTLGRSAADALLPEIGRRLQNALRTSDLVASSAGEPPLVATEGREAFTVLLPQLAQDEDAVLVAQRLQASVASPIDCAGNSVTPSCSIGISLYPADAEAPRELLALARSALGEARRQGTEQICRHGADPAR